MPVPWNFVEPGSIEDAKMLIHFAEERNVPIKIPEDFLCNKESSPTTFNVISSNCLLNGKQALIPAILLTSLLFALVN